ncbi:MAG: zinc ribbon domain-containing protein [Chloroflexi bacterium]|nr:zinc ribbon domain-containing protein [Chloroflexota bacterium]
MLQFNLGEADGLLSGLVIYGGLVLVAVWLAMIFWTYRDMRARSRDHLVQIAVALMVAILTVPGLLIYLFLRPRETLSEAYERSLEEEALLQEIEEKPVCPGCRQRVQDDWQVCPHCHTRLKRPCPTCGRILELGWDLCPHCATTLTSYTRDRNAALYTDVQSLSDQWVASASYDMRGGAGQARRSDGLEFVDNDDV